MKKTMRLDKMLGRLGHGTRSGVKTLVRQGAVAVNGVRARDPGMQVDPERDVVTLNGETIAYREWVYVLLHKPAGVVSATEDLRDRTVLDLLPPSLRVFSPFPVGRLDKDTEGLLLLTNDGQLAHELLSPRKHVPKTYRALVKGEVGEAERRAFADGVTLGDGYRTLPARLRLLATAPAEAAAAAKAADGEEAAGAAELAGAVERLETERALAANAAELALAQSEGAVLSWIELQIREGKYHQVKRMFEALGRQVLYLRRVAMGPLGWDASLGPGQWRELTAEETGRLREDPTGTGR